MSNAIESLKRLVFNGILVQEELRSLESQGLGIRIPLSPTAKLEQTDFSPQIIYQAEQMAPVFTLFHCLENAVRELISDRLSERHGSGWWEKCVSPKIKKAAQSLKDKEERNKFHVPRATAMIGYTTFSNLGQLITNNWEDFADFFPDQHWISSRLNDVELSRNIIMHTGILPETEIGRMQGIARDWIRQVG